MIGKCKWFNNKKGYGFLETEEQGGKDLFVHFSEIQMQGYKTLKTGDVVEYEIKESDKGPTATNVKVITEEKK